MNDGEMLGEFVDSLKAFGLRNTIRFFAPAWSIYSATRTPMEVWRCKCRSYTRIFHLDSIDVYATWIGNRQVSEGHDKTREQADLRSRGG